MTLTSPSPFTSAALAANAGSEGDSHCFTTAYASTAFAAFTQLPVFVAVSVYVPGATLGNEYVPVALDDTVNAVPVAGVSVTVALPIGVAGVFA